MKCKFCFATFLDVKRDMQLPKGHLPEEDCIKVVKQIAKFGFEKMNYVGGELTLCLKVGIEAVLKQISIDPERFRQRGGEYGW